MKPPLNHMMLNTGTLADEFDAILNYRTTHAGLVLAASGDPANAVKDESSTSITDESTTVVTDET